MNLINKIQREVIYTIELTQDELDVLVAAFGITSTATRGEVFRRHKLPEPMTNDRSSEFYKSLEKLSSFNK